MPELPDVVVYIEALEARIAGARLERVRLANPFLLRSVDPPLSASTGRRVSGLRRLGKRIVIGLEGDLFLVLHLMIAGRLHWKPAGAKLGGKIGLAAFDFSSGTLVLTEAGTKRRAALYLVGGEAALREHDPGGLEVLDADLGAFRAALASENHTPARHSGGTDWGAAREARGQTHAARAGGRGIGRDGRGGGRGRAARREGGARGAPERSAGGAGGADPHAVGRHGAGTQRLKGAEQ